MYSFGEFSITPSEITVLNALNIQDNYKQQNTSNQLEKISEELILKNDKYKEEESIIGYMASLPISNINNNEKTSTLEHMNSSHSVPLTPQSSVSFDTVDLGIVDGEVQKAASLTSTNRVDQKSITPVDTGYLPGDSLNQTDKPNTLDLTEDEDGYIDENLCHLETKSITSSDIQTKAITSLTLADTGYLPGDSLNQTDKPNTLEGEDGYVDENLCRLEPKSITSSDIQTKVTTPLTLVDTGYLPGDSSNQTDKPNTLDLTEDVDGYIDEDFCHLEPKSITSIQTKAITPLTLVDTGYLPGDSLNQTDKPNTLDLTEEEDGYIDENLCRLEPKSITSSDIQTKAITPLTLVDTGYLPGDSLNQTDKPNTLDLTEDEDGYIDENFCHLEPKSITSFDIQTKAITPLTLVDTGYLPGDSLNQTDKPNTLDLTEEEDGYIDENLCRLEPKSITSSYIHTKAITPLTLVDTGYLPNGETFYTASPSIPKPMSSSPLFKPFHQLCPGYIPSKSLSVEWSTDDCSRMCNDTVKGQNILPYNEIEIDLCDLEVDNDDDQNVTNYISS